ncbi:hypothetical protein ONS95_003017 [Cadophora gregata]|uniref:uncharacterized protein n=1 Tax=Cadophora gregata TaxID=51156 RepID=UPI0026DDB16B|nr:uncharacterized protein ONS95_003017 [Cadophora gregata]KAK0108195.1 hypothetical protein ONS95_003017 [Cadophora gregata]KAK0109213.1 hypothetical protein ONS96_003036 [Cadophora gregata f. sp. sojae]
MAEVLRRRQELLPNLKVLRGIEEYIEIGDQLHNEDEYVTSAGSDDEFEHGSGSN